MDGIEAGIAIDFDAAARDAVTNLVCARDHIYGPTGWSQWSVKPYGGR